MDRGQRNFERIVYFFLGLVCVIFFIVGYKGYTGNIEFQKGTVEISGVITSIERYGSGEDVKHSVEVEYVVDGRSYEKEIGFYSSNMYEGQAITLCYHPETPGDAHVMSSNILFFGFMLGGGIALVFLIIFSLIRKSQNRREYRNRRF